MISTSIVIAISLLYFGLLFAVAFYADQRQKAGRSIIANAHVYTLSLAVLFTAWTFYGSVGRAATVGLDFFPFYLAPTLLAFSWWLLLRKTVRISKEQHLTTIADFISSRYGKSTALGAIVTLFAVVGIMPYIALQLKAVAHSFEILTAAAVPAAAAPPYADTAFLAALLLAGFAILFGARHLDASERHEGLVAAVALEALVKLIAFVAVGLFVTYGLFDGFGDIFTRFAERFPERQELLLLGTETVPYSTWLTLSLTILLATMLLPRQFHIMVIENSREEHIRAAMWRFPLYTFLLTLFILPVALGGLLFFNGDTSHADFYVLLLPLQTGHPWLALLVFIGGFSAAAGMVMVESVALSTMILNQLLMPLILKFKLEAGNLPGLLINLKRLGILGVILLGYLYYKIIGESYALVNIGLVSFIAACQFAPAFLGALYWKRGNRSGAIAGLMLGGIVWFYTLVIPSSVRSGWLESAILDQGLFGLALLKPLALFGLEGLDIWSHALYWTLFLNTGAYIAVSLATRPGKNESEQANKFVDVFGSRPQTEPLMRISRAPTVLEFVDLMSKFIGEKQAHAAITEYLGDAQIDQRGSLSEYDLPELKRFTERTLAGSVGAAPARIILENYLETRGSRMEDVFDIFGSVTISRRAGREQLGVLHETARIVASGVDLQTILDEILQLFLQQFKFDLCVIRLLDQEAQTLTVRSQRGMSSAHLGDSERALTLDTYVGETFLANELVVANDTDFLDKPLSALVIHREGIKSFAHAPITIEGEPVGVLSAFSKTAKGIFTDEFLELFKNLAAQVGVAWRNARQTTRLIKARERERELQIAKTIQAGLLPDCTPVIQGLALAGICVPAQEVGGDYYDYLQRDADTVDLVLADVSGHNVGAALLMAQTRTFIQAKGRELRTASEVMTTLNSFFYADLTRAELFITMFYLKYHSPSRTLSFANAGHNPPLVWRAATGTCEYLDAEGLILGIRKQVTFEEKQIQLQPGDLLLLYTDGLTEAENAVGEFFGTERLCALLQQNFTLSTAEIIDLLLRQGRLFAGFQHFKDDVTLVVMRVLK